MLKVAMVLKDFKLGGGPRAVYYLCKSMPQIKFFVFGQKGIMFHDFLGLPNVEVIFIDKWNFSYVKLIKEKIVNENIDILHFHHILPALFFIWIRNNIPKIITFHGLHIKKYYFKFNPLMKLVRKVCKYLVLKSFDHVIVLTENDRIFLETLFENSFHKKISVVPNAIDLSEIVLEQDDTTLKAFDCNYFNILMVARYDFQKGHDLLFRAINKIVDRLKNIKFCFVGDHIIKKMIEDKPLIYKEHAIYLSDTLQPYNYIKSADALIIPSRWEGLPMVALEALSLKTRVIASSHANISFMKDNKNVFIYDFGDIQDLIRQINNCINVSHLPVDYDLTPFSPTIVSSQTEKLYTELAHRKKTLNSV